MAIPLPAVLAGCLDWTAEVMAGIGEEQGEQPTPCAEFTVHQLATHLISGLAWYGELPAGGATDPRDVPGPDLTRGRYDEAFRAVHVVVRRNWTAQHLAETYPLPHGTVTGSGITEYMIVETLGHGWDLAVSTGQGIHVAPDLAEAALTIAQGLGEQTLRSPGMMAAAVTVDEHAPAIDRFVAFLGRQPRPGVS